MNESLRLLQTRGNMPKSDVKKTQKKVRMEREGWYIGTKMYCAGKPSRYADEDGNPVRIKCGYVMEGLYVPLGALSQIVANQSKLLREAGWSNPVTLGKRTWLCPDCLIDVKAKRVQYKDLLGRAIDLS